VKGYREEVAAGESRLFYLNCMKKQCENQQQRMAEEMKTYMSSDPQERKKSYRYVIPIGFTVWAKGTS